MQEIAFGGLGLLESLKKEGTQHNNSVCICSVVCFWEVLPTGNEKVRGHANDNVGRAFASVDENFFPFCT